MSECFLILTLKTSLPYEDPGRGLCRKQTVLISASDERTLFLVREALIENGVSTGSG